MTAYLTCWRADDATASLLAVVAVLLLTCSTVVRAAELSVEDFSFDEPLGSEGATIEKLAPNHFRVTLGHAPNQPTWCNKLQFKILRNAKGNTLRLDVVFNGGNAYVLHEYFHSWSYDGKNWHPTQWQTKAKDTKEPSTIVFPEFAEDVVYVGHQVPMSHEDLLDMIKEWEKNPCVKVHVVGKTLGGRDMHRIEITDPNSPHPPSKRWVHYFANQHPGEHNSQWRMVGMINWLLSDEAAECRKNSICHFIIMMSPDAPSKGWYRTNAQGVDMNRSYSPSGADKEKQAHEAYIWQKDLEELMASEAPVTDVWAMHTWGGIVEPICQPGPEMGTTLGPWTDLRDAIERHDTRNLIKPLRVQKPTRDDYWTGGPNKQFGITVFLCEGAGAIYTKQDNMESGVALIKGLVEYYRGTRP